MEKIQRLVFVAARSSSCGSSASSRFDASTHKQILAAELPCQSRLQALAESYGHIKRTAVADQADNIASPVQNGNAVFARLEMLVHSLAERRLDVVVDIVRQFPPNLNATDLYGGHVTRVSLSSNSRLRCSMPRRVRAPVHRVSSILPEAIGSSPKPG
jgi:hypothetical protein